jgi:hypothetical protein
MVPGEGTGNACASVRCRFEEEIAMTRNSGGATIDRSSAPEPDRDEVGGRAGDARAKGKRPSPDDRDQTSSADDPAPVDLDSAHDRAS